MATSLAAQLAQIAAKSKISLDVKAQKAIHGKSLIFEPRVAAAQTFQSVFAICVEGFDELCQLDERFVPFADTLFSELSQDEDRTQMSEAENAALDQKIEAFLRLVGAKMRLMPAIKSIEWLIRRFRIHEFNTAAVITTFLPYHSIPAFVTLMSILPTNLPHEYRFLSPYIRSLTPVPRAAIVQHATQHFELLVTISKYALDAARAQQHYPGLVTFWGGVMTEAISGMLDALRSGRKSLQADNTQNVLQRVGPILGEALVVSRAPGMQIAAYMAVSVFVSKAALSDMAITAFMDQLVVGWTAETVKPGLVCLAILAQYRSAKQLSRKVAKAVLKVAELPQLLVEIGRQRRVDKLASGLVLALIERLAKKAAVRSLPVIKAILLGGILHEKQLAVAFKALLLAAHSITDEIDPAGSTRKELGAMLVVLSQVQAEAGGDVIRKVIEDVDFDIEELELKLDATLRPSRTLLLLESGDAAMANGIDEAAAAAAPALSPSSSSQLTSEDVDRAVERLAQLPRPASCLAAELKGEGLFEPLSQLLISAVASGKAELEHFDSAPLLGRADAASDCFYFSFFMRVWSGPYPTLARAAALDRAAARLGQDDCSGVDFQAMLPYCIAAMLDAAKKVRRAAAQLLSVLAKLSPPSDDNKRWGSAKLYEEQDGRLTWLSASARSSLVGVMTESADEAVLHEDHLSVVLKDALDKSSKGNKADGAAQAAHLSHGTRLAMLTFLASHAVATPLIAVKLRLLRTLNEVRGVSGTTRTQLLLPLLRWWAGLSAAEAHGAAEREAVDESSMDARSVEVVVPNDKAGLECLFDTIQRPAGTERPGLLHAAFGRIRKMWPVMKEDFQLVTAQLLLELVHREEKEEEKEEEEKEEQQPLVAEEAAEVLQQVELSTQILGQFLEGLQHTAKMASGPASKRRRTSSMEQHHHHQQQVASAGGGQTAAAAELREVLRRTTFVLQLVEGSRPAEHPELLPGLFVVLSDLQAMRAVVGSELGYLQNVVLGCLLAMMPAYESDRRLKIAASVGHGDVLVSCIHKSSSPAVQNTALLLVASLARTAPEVVLHSVMPIFTLMGGSVLRHGDDYSAHVVSQTIREVIPPLIDTFRRGRRNVVASAADLLSSFVIAYEHIPSHRRRDLFLSLIENLGPGDFLFAVLAMFADRYGPVDSTAAFLADLMGAFPAAVQLQALVQLVGLVRDVFQARPALAATLLGRKEEGGSVAGSAAVEDLQRSALKELTLLPQLLANRRLREAVGRLDEADDDMESAKIRELYAQLLEDVLTLADTIKKHGSSNNGGKTAQNEQQQQQQQQQQQLLQQLHGRCGDALAQLLGLQSIGEFVKAVETLLDRPSMGVRQKVLRALEVRVEAEAASSVRARAALLAFLPQLTAVIRDSDDVAYKHTAVTCVDKIADKYGRRDLEAVTAAAAAIAGDGCLGLDQGGDRRLRVMALLCLASLVDVLQEAVVPILPTAVPRALACLSESLVSAGAGRRLDAELHNAAYSFVMALAQHLPFMLTGAYLDRLLASSSVSAEAGFGSGSSSSAQLQDEAASDANASRRHCLQLLAKQVEAKVMFGALWRNWRGAVAAGHNATTEYIQILQTAIDKHGKSAIVKNLPTLSAIFQSACDLRREARLAAAAQPERTKATAAAAVTTTATTTTTTAVSPTILPHLPAIETAVHTAALHMVFKLNDAAFRPVFADLMAWCDRGLPQLDVLGRCLRQQSVYGFLLLFFDRLKSAVTTYAAYVTDGATAALRSARVGSSADDRLLWARVLQTLAACFSHDADNGSGGDGGYWQVPAHFAAVAPVLVEQFAKSRDLQKVVDEKTGETDDGDGEDDAEHAEHAELLISEALIPAVVQLARAANAPEHQKELNGLLLKRLRSPHAAERLAVVRCQQALAEAVGEEWLAMLPEMLPYVSELQDDDDENVDRETHRWINTIEGVLGESLDAMLQ